MSETLTGSLPAFKFPAATLNLNRVARLSRAWDQAGRRAALLAEEGGSFEAWVYPYQIIRQVHLAFLPAGTSTPIAGNTLVQRIEVTPATTTLTYVHESFTVQQVAVAPLNNSGVLLLFSLQTLNPLQMIVSFMPALQPMWPAALGGQYSVWDPAVNAYYLSEARGRIMAYFGSPCAQAVTLPPAHQLAETPSQFRFDLTPENCTGRYLPLVVCATSEGIEKARQIFSALAGDPQTHVLAAHAYYESLLVNHLHIETPEPELGEAARWALVALDALRVQNADLGEGLIAGLGAAGHSGRPGFGWFFGGDACMNSLGLTIAGCWETVRSALRFMAKYQREDGKMPHEITQSAGLLNWFDDYGYAYSHGDTTPFYIVALHSYVKASGDLAFLREAWPYVLKAYQFCLDTDANADGLMDNAKAGLAAMEFGDLTQIASDIYLAAIGSAALRDVADMATWQGDKKLARDCEKQFAKAYQMLNWKLWLKEESRFAFALGTDGKLSSELTAWQALPVMLGVAEPFRAQSTMRALAASEMVTDWGLRILSAHSRLFHPLNYNYGAVWPFLSGFAAWAHYRVGRASNGLDLLRATARDAFDWTLGNAPELLSSASYTPLAAAVPHQGFSSLAALLPLARGLCGLEVNAVEKKLTFAPQMPADWPWLHIHGVHAGALQCDFMLEQAADQGTLRLKVQVRGNPDGWTLRFAPKLGLLAQIRSVMINGKAMNFVAIPSESLLATPSEPAQTPPKLLSSNEPVRPWQTITPITIPLTDRSELVVSYRPGISVSYDTPAPQAGMPSQGLRILDELLLQVNGAPVSLILPHGPVKDAVLLLKVAGRGGHVYHLRLQGPYIYEDEQGNPLLDSALPLKFPVGEGYQEVDVRLRLKAKD